MQSGPVAEAWFARLTADVTLLGLLGGPHIYPAQTERPVRIPSVEYLLTERIAESFAVMELQVDFWVKGQAKALALEARLYELTHHDIGQMLGTLQVWMTFRDSRLIDFPSQPGVAHRAMRFDVSTVRAKYTTP